MAQTRPVPDSTKGKGNKHPYLECDVDSLEGTLKDVTAVLTPSTWAVTVEGKRLALQVHLLQVARVATQTGGGGGALSAP